MDEFEDIQTDKCTDGYGLIDTANPADRLYIHLKEYSYPSGCYKLNKLCSGITNTALARVRRIICIL